MAKSKLLISVQGLSVTFFHGQRQTEAVRNISFDIQQGERLAIVGESGSGKSVTALSLMHLLPPGSHGKMTGKVTFDGDDLFSLPEERLRHLRAVKAGMIFQEPMTALNPLHKIGRQIMEALEIQGTPESERPEQAKHLLNQVGLDPEIHFRKYPFELSGGQRQRVVIAIALCGKPKLLIADEPTTALDVTTQRQILRLILKICEEQNMSLLFITHDLEVVQKVAERMLVMKDGKIVEEGPVKALFKSPKEIYTQELLNVFPQEERGKPQTIVTLKVKDLEVNYPKGRAFLPWRQTYFQALQPLSFNVKAGETLGVVGESGCGKTSLAQALLRLNPGVGKIYLGKTAFHTLKSKDLKVARSGLQMVFQDPYESLSPRMTVRDIVGEGLDVHQRLTPQDREAKICAIMKQVGLTEDMLDRYPHEFSGGQRQRIALARVLILEPKVLVLDEPTSALDRSVQVEVVDLLLRLQKTLNLGYIFISHDLRLVRHMSHRLMVLKDGACVEAGESEAIFSKPKHFYTQHLLKAAVDII